MLYPQLSNVRHSLEQVKTISFMPPGPREHHEDAPEDPFSFDAMDPADPPPHPAYIRVPKPSSAEVVFSILVPRPQGPSIWNETGHVLPLSWVTLVEVCVVRTFHMT